MAVSKRLRYEVLKRDNSTCRDCGRRAPDVVVEVDHVTPKTLGGTDEPTNLATRCKDCNGGKGSTNPDAPMVAAVAEDALRWSLAIRRAQASMLEDIDARGADREQFRKWWDGWEYGEGETRRTVPLDPDWWVTIDQLRAAGLPLAILKDCIDGSMSRRKVRDENKFRYMCGIAWKKVAELQRRAAQIARGGDSRGAGDDEAEPADRDSYDMGRLDVATDLLGDLDPEEIEYFMAKADMSEYCEEGEPPQTKAEIYCDAITFAFANINHNADYLAGRIEETLQALPGDIGERALAVPPTRLDALLSPGARKVFHLSDALQIAVDLLNVPAAREYMRNLPESEQAEWLEFAAALNPDGEPGTDVMLVRAAKCAKVIADGRYYPVMCEGPGQHIRFCPRRGTYRARVTGLKCCDSGAEPEHKGHSFCEPHKEALETGTFLAKDGLSYSATEFTGAEEAVPF